MWDILADLFFTLVKRTAVPVPENRRQSMSIWVFTVLLALILEILLEWDTEVFNRSRRETFQMAALDSKINYAFIWEMWEEGTVG